MRYISTRGQAPALGFADVTLAGLASDGGLYVPESWPQVSTAQMQEWRNLSYSEVAARVMLPESAMVTKLRRVPISRLRMRC